jgi:hypothetical protein
VADDGATLSRACMCDGEAGVGARRHTAITHGGTRGETYRECDDNALEQPICEVLPLEILQVPFEERHECWFICKGKCGRHGKLLHAHLGAAAW